MKYNLHKLFIKVFFYINKVIPKNDYSLYMLQFMPFKDNIAALLDELKKHDCYKKYKIYLHGYNLQEYKDKNVVCVKPYSLSSLWHYCRSSRIFCDNGIYGFTFTEKQKLIFLTHGMTVKKYGYYIPEYFSERESYGCMPHRAASIVIATSEIFVEVNSKAMGVPKSDVIVTGLPRNDFLFNNVESALFMRLCSNHKKYILWMPTYRRSNIAKDGENGADYELGLPLIDSSNINAFDDFLNNLNVLLVIKRHTLQNASNSDLGEFRNIRFVDSDDIVNSNEPLYSFIKEFDALITDYSSVFYDFLLLDRPICNIVDDIKEYQGNRGLVFDNPEEKMASIVKNFDQLLAFISNVSKDIDPDINKRHNLDLLFNKFHDNKNSLRVLKQCGIQI